MVYKPTPMFEKHVRDPVHGYIGLTEVEKEIIDTYPVQRLRRIKQLSVSSIAYPGGDHARFSHALGTMHLAGKVAESLKTGTDISDEDWQFIRLAGLLHDIGHGPFSHSYEEILSADMGMTHEDMGEKVIRESSLAGEIEAQGYNPDELAELIFGDPKGEKYMKQIITSQFDADKMDFLVRDSYFTGVEYGQIDVHRLIQAMEVVDEDIAIDKKALSALETFMIARYEMFLTVYYHHSVRAAEIMLNTAMRHSKDLLGLTDFEDIEEFLQLDDAYLMNGLRGLDPSEYEGEDREDAEIAKQFYEMLTRRELLKPAYNQNIHVEDEYVAGLMGDKSVREHKEKEIAEEAGVDPEEVTVDVPTLTSLPYYPREIDPLEVPVFEDIVGEGKELIPLSKQSRLVDVLKGYVDLVRVYTSPEARKEVGEAAEKVFGKSPLSAQVSM